MTTGIRPRTRSAGAGDHHRGHVVLVHGTLDESASFRRVLDSLRNWDTTTYDRRGWGSAAALGPGTLHQNVADLIEILPATASIVVGHSYGATVALTASERCPQRIRAVVAYEPPLPWLPWWPTRAPWERLALDEGRTPADAAEAIMRDVLGDEAWERLPRRLADKRRDDGETMVAEMRALCDDPPSFEPLTLTCPVLTAAGADSLPHHRLTAAELAQLVPTGRYQEITGAGHPGHVSHPADFAALVEAADQLADEPAERDQRLVHDS
ncbi:alpha/beta hydrolase [Nocardia sp. NPDC049190]|uniref:alpha/beta fold hydrolase n=1 Tax=Nocardia sp. NPDC049190 TaxID=3155650 RepID=UPI00340FFB13